MLLTRFPLREEVDADQGSEVRRTVRFECRLYFREGIIKPLGYQKRKERKIGEKGRDE